MILCSPLLYISLNGDFNMLLTASVSLVWVHLLSSLVIRTTVNLGNTWTYCDELKRWGGCEDFSDLLSKSKNSVYKMFWNLFRSLIRYLITTLSLSFWGSAVNHKPAGNCWPFQRLTRVHTCGGELPFYIRIWVHLVHLVHLGSFR